MRRDEPDVFEPEAQAPLPAPPGVVIAALGRIVTDERLAKLTKVAACRTRSVVAVLEDITDPHNTSAILRSAEAFGVQEVHIVSGARGFAAAHRVARGTDQWLDLVRHEDADACGASLRGRGYDIVIAAADGELTPEDVRKLPRVAIVFGNEHRGASSTMRAQAKHTYAIPMVGFVESLNVSVAAAVTLYAAAHGRQGDLSPEEQDEVLARFLLTSVRDARRVVAEYVRSL
jgi:tRNA (guanosine-2'-O-)-methyltransferase